MLTTDIKDIVFFFGAGASAPFGIPTMKQFVTEFERLVEEGTKSERVMYANIKENLERRLNRQVDLEAIFTVIDGIVAFSPEKLGLLSTYLAGEIKEVMEDERETGRSLRTKFQNFVRERCVIPQESFDRIGAVYHDFFNRFALELREAGVSTNGDYAWHDSWEIFTTNYDTCLEYYWRVKAGAGIDTGFEFDTARNVSTLRSEKFLRNIGKQLVKLHGSVNWLIEERTGDVIEEEMTSGHSYLGRKFVGEMMIYPIAEKELYLDPYISMLLRLNRELQQKSTWIVVGYSFNDPVVREIFLRRSNTTKHLVLVHPQAKSILDNRLSGMKAKTSLVEKRFGLLEDAITTIGHNEALDIPLKEEDFRKVNHQIIHKLVDNPRYSWEKTPVP